MSNIADFLTNNPSAGAGKFQLRVGATVAQNDAVEMGPDGLIYPVLTTDYASVANAGSQIIAQTQITSAFTSGEDRQAFAVGPDGCLYFVTPNSGGNGCKLTRYTPMGTQPISVVLDSTATALNQKRIFFLSNGKIAVVWACGTNLQFTILDSGLNTVVATTVIDASCFAGSNDAIPLTGGGFAVCWLNSPNQKFAIYGNNGAAVYASATIQTWGAAPGAYTRMAQLSSGDVAIAVVVSATGTNGLYHAIRSTVGAQVLAMTNLDSTASLILPEISSLNAFYAITKQIGPGSLIKGWVLNNAGAVQGAPFSASTAFGNNRNSKLVNDGTAFFLLWSDSNATGSLKMTKLPTSGTGYISQLTNAPGSYGTYIDAFYERGMIGVINVSSGNVTPSFFVIRPDFVLMNNNPGFGVAPGTNIGSAPAIIPVGDFAFAACYDYSATAGTNFYIGKYANSAVIGVAAAATGVGNLVGVSGLAGAYLCNGLRGTASKQFDHSATNVYGNKGALLSNGAVLKGL